MTREHDRLRTFREEYLDYVEGLRPAPPSLASLSDEDRRRAEQWVKSLHAARGVDPYASRPSVDELLARARARERSLSDEELQAMLQSSLREGVDSRAVVARDPAAIAAGLASRLLVQARGTRLRVIVEPPGTDIDSAYRDRVTDIAAVFGMYPETRAVLLMTAGAVPEGAVVDRYDVVTAIETPSGERRPPRIRRPLTGAVTACRQFILEAVPVFRPFQYEESSAREPISELVDPVQLARASVEQVAVAGRRARVDAKRSAWGEFGQAESSLLCELIRDAMLGSFAEDDFRERLYEIVDAA